MARTAGIAAAHPCHLFGPTAAWWRGRDVSVVATPPISLQRDEPSRFFRDKGENATPFRLSAFAAAVKTERSQAMKIVDVR
jgi:hypothetical protein